MIKPAKNSDIDNKDLIKFIDEDKPVMIDVDRYFLDYLSIKFGKSHFGFHSVLIIGYRDRKELEFALYDFLTNDLVWYPSSKLLLARTSIWQPFAPEGKHYTFDNINMIDEKLVRNPIESNCRRILNPSDIKNSGIDAMDALADEILGLIEFINSPQSIHLINLQINLIISYLKEFEQTGTFYRKIYSSFLKESSNYEGLKNLEEFSYKLDIIAEKWVYVIKNLMNDLKPIMC